MILYRLLEYKIPQQLLEIKSTFLYDFLTFGIYSRTFGKLYKTLYIHYYGNKKTD